MKIKEYSISTKECKNICKSPCLWGHRKDKKSIVPLIYFQKPKWMDEEDFKHVIKNLTLKLSIDYEFKEK